MKLLKELKKVVDKYLDQFLPEKSSFPSIIYQAMRYSIFAGGKRIRPILLILSYDACGGQSREKIMGIACALEMIHTYSLIHDDLPSMDNDDLRRGKPTLHKVFGEAVAILAGDALFSRAFYTIAHSDIQPETLNQAERVLTNAISDTGIVGGQVVDIEMAMQRKKALPKILRYIHSHKTAIFISASCEIGGILANTSSSNRLHLRNGGLALGMAFQILDDVLDVVGDEKIVGKNLRTDENKITYPQVYGIEGSKRRVEKYTDLAIKEFSALQGESSPLIKTAQFLMERMY